VYIYTHIYVIINAKELIESSKQHSIFFYLSLHLLHFFVSLGYIFFFLCYFD